MNKKPIKKSSIFNLLKKIKKIKLGDEIIALENSNNRFLSKAIKSKINLPPFNNSAVDGYAILKNDINNTNGLFCTRRIAAGDKKNIKIKSGEAVRVFTGARMPSNSSTIIMQENTSIDKDKIKILKSPSFGENYRLKGEDIRKNQKILSKGSKINHQNINLIAASGLRKVKVFKKIKIAFFTSGNELRRPTDNLKNSKSSINMIRTGRFLRADFDFLPC